MHSTDLAGKKKSLLFPLDDYTQTYAMLNSPPLISKFIKADIQQCYGVRKGWGPCLANTQPACLVALHLSMTYEWWELWFPLCSHSMIVMARHAHDTKLTHGFHVIVTQGEKQANTAWRYSTWTTGNHKLYYQPASLTPPVRSILKRSN